MIIEELRKDRGKFGDNRETNKGDIELDVSFLLHKLLSVSFIVVLEFEMGILLLLHNLIMTDLENILLFCIKLTKDKRECYKRMKLLELSISSIKSILYF